MQNEEDYEREESCSEVLSKKFLNQFKTEADVSKFLKQLHAQVLEKMLEGEMDVHLGYEKNSVSGHNSGNSPNGSYPKKIQTEHDEAVIPILHDRNGEFESIVVPKHESRGLSIEKLVISLYAKGMSVSDIEEEMREIYEIELSTSAISIITNKVNQGCSGITEPPFGSGLSHRLDGRYCLQGS